MHGKSIVFDGRDVSRDRSRSWSLPPNAGGGVVAAPDPDNVKGPWGREHRAIWQLLPQKRCLTSPPRGWTDESPRLLDDGSVLFVRTRQTSFRPGEQWYATDHGTLELLGRGAVTAVADVTFTANQATGDGGSYYGHYPWPTRVAVTP
jgi:predicted outer membrane repeat protein